MATDFTQNLEACFQFEETSGNRTDSKNSRVLTDNNTVGYTASGKFDNAADFVKSNSEYLSASNANAPYCQPHDADWQFFTWVQFDATGSWEYIIRKNNVVEAVKRGDDKMSISFWKSGGGGATLTTTGTVSASKWYALWGWFIASTQYVYMRIRAADDTLDETKSNNFSGDINETTDNFDVCKKSSFYADLQLDNLSFWSAYHSTAEQNEFWNSGTGFDYEDYNQSGGGGGTPVTISTAISAAGTVGTSVTRQRTISTAISAAASLGLDVSRAKVISTAISGAGSVGTSLSRARTVSTAITGAGSIGISITRQRVISAAINAAAAAGITITRQRCVVCDVTGELSVVIYLGPPTITPPLIVLVQKSKSWAEVDDSKHLVNVRKNKFYAEL